MEGWVERPYDEMLAAAHVASGESSLVARLLAARNVSVDGLDDYFNADFRRLASPLDLPGVDEAADIILSHLSKGAKIVVFGDYDCDGICATAIMARTLKAISQGAKLASEIVAFIPHRLTEGYGLGEASVERMLSIAPDVSLVVTVDNGITAVGPIASLKEKGIEVVVTDHHLRQEVLPAASVIVNPKVASPEYFSDLCGAGVAYFLANELVRRSRAKFGPQSVVAGIGSGLLILAGLATVTDIMPLRLQNRILVSEALKHFHTWAPVGLAELNARAMRSAGALTTRDFGFGIGPRINASGRLSTGEDALALAMCGEEEREKAREIALKVDLCNIERRQVEQKMTDAALAMAQPGAGAHVVAFSTASAEPGTVHPGVAGVVASRVMDRMHDNVPVCILVDGKGSLRAYPPYNVCKALEKCRHLLTRYGGHAQAAGVAVEKDNIDAFKVAFADACRAQIEEAGVGAAGMKYFDCALSPKDITLNLAESIARMAPFGEGNPEPVFALQGVHFTSSGIRPLGYSLSHLQFTFRERNIPRAVWWNQGAQIEKLRAQSASAFDILFTLSVSEYGSRHVELSVVDMKKSE